MFFQTLRKTFVVLQMSVVTVYEESEQYAQRKESGDINNKFESKPVCSPLYIANFSQVSKGLIYAKTLKSETHCSVLFLLTWLFAVKVYCMRDAGVATIVAAADVQAHLRNKRKFCQDPCFCF